jgi:hypothetical protein
VQADHRLIEPQSMTELSAVTCWMARVYFDKEIGERPTWGKDNVPRKRLETDEKPMPNLNANPYSLDKQGDHGQGLMEQLG